MLHFKFFRSDSFCVQFEVLNLIYVVNGIADTFRLRMRFFKESAGLVSLGD